MFNIGTGELTLIAVAALLVLGPKRLPELARGIGKFMREFRRQTDEVRHVVEREFYTMDREVQSPPVTVRPADEAVASNARHEEDAAPEALPPPADDGASQLTAGRAPAEPVPAPEPTQKS